MFAEKWPSIRNTSVAERNHNRRWITRMRPALTARLSLTGKTVLVNGKMHAFIPSEQKAATASRPVRVRVRITEIGIELRSRKSDDNRTKQPAGALQSPAGCLINNDCDHLGLC